MNGSIRLFCLGIFLSICFAVQAGSIRLFNDSPYKLRAVVRGADGSQLGELLINPDQSSTWTDSYGQFGPNGYVEDTPNKSQTPYAVIWYCLDGNSYSICNIVSTGATVTAQTCDGDRICKPQKKNKQGMPNLNEDESQ